ncbi:hypothetical protein A2U01_0103383, partial [Trifolium medium]|nr:hypothetical protein [Trifolium medium]
MSSIFQSRTAYTQGHRANTSASAKDEDPNPPHPQTTAKDNDLTAPSTGPSAGNSAKPSTNP